ncbi:transcription elongation factor GreA [SAR202 cluster bacterium AD-804-J14_MRT_500m]|nr:transcription elongation factor GreA [SAR202 cluster bacterium AD-804-J14_MRT_500m]
MAEPTYLTSEGLAKLREEAEVFRTARRQGVAARIQRANSIGGTVDNAEYEEAKKEQAFIEGHILDLAKIINNAKIIDTSRKPSGVVQIGSKVKVLNQNKNIQVVYQILGSPETNPSKGRISNLSPIGSALLGKQIGDVAVVQVPAGTINLEILEIK